MSKFTFHQNGSTGDGEAIYDVTHVESRHHLGLVAKERGHGWTCYVKGRIESGFPTRNAAAERLLLLAVPSDVAKAALPDDPFEGIAPE